MKVMMTRIRMIILIIIIIVAALLKPKYRRKSLLVKSAFNGKEGKPKRHKEKYCSLKFSIKLFHIFSLNIIKTLCKESIFNWPYDIFKQQIHLHFHFISDKFALSLSLFYVPMLSFLLLLHSFVTSLPLFLYFSCSISLLLLLSFFTPPFNNSIISFLSLSLLLLFFHSPLSLSLSQQTIDCVHILLPI